MGLRYRKSVKICKGVKVNFSKSGPSLSIGGRGNSYNFSKRGTRHTIGIPGTGLSYTSSSHKRKRSTSSKRRSSYVRVPSSVNLKMNDKGKVTILDNSGNEITDAAIIRRIKASNGYKMTVANLDKQRKEKIEEMVSNSEEENQKFLNLHTYSCNVRTRDEYEEEITDLKPEVFEIMPYDVAKPNEESVRKELMDEAKEMIKGFFLLVNKQRKEYVEEHLSERLNEDMKKWEEDNAIFKQDQEEQKEIYDQQFLEDYEEDKQFLIDKMNGEEEAICDDFDSWINEIELPVEININYDWAISSGLMLLDVDLPEIEDLPQTIMVKTDSGNIKEKKKTQSDLRVEYAKVVFGLAMMIASHAFDISLAVKGVVISGYTQRRNKTGDISDTYVYSIYFKRSQFEHVEVSKMEPIQFCLNSESRINMTSTGLLKEIKPYDYKDLI